MTAACGRQPPSPPPPSAAPKINLADIEAVRSALPADYEIGDLDGPVSAASLWGFGTGEQAPKYRISPSLKLGLLFTTRPTRDSHFSFRWTTTLGGRILRTCIELNGATLGDRSGNQVYKTLLHEIAHVLAGPKAKHGPTWKSIVHRLGGDATKFCSAENLYMRSRLVCTVQPEQHIFGRALRARATWSAHIGRPCPRGGCSGTLHVVRLPKQ
jgi:predicted SprT family Zn-dependent metalloprotease